MTDEEKAARAEKARQAKAEAAKRRSEAIEAAQVAEIESVWDQIPDEKRRMFDYIRTQIASGHRDQADILDLRKSRAVHFRQFRRFIPDEQEANCA